MAPRYAYLDQNQWIYLARDYWGKPQNQAHRGIAEQLLGKVSSDEIRLPLSSIHFIEHLRAESAARRQRLAEVFDLFSAGWFMASWSQVLPVEIHRAIVKAFAAHCSVPPPEVFGKGFLFGLGPKQRELLCEGRTEQRVQDLRTIAALPGAVLDLLTFPNESGRRQQNERVSKLGEANAAAAEGLRSARRSDSVEEHRRAQYAGYTLHHQDSIFPALGAVGRTPDDFLALGIEGLSRFWSDVPSLDVDCELALYRDRQWTRRVHENDMRDIGHLALAVPYCDVVVTERFWTRAAEETGLSTKYGATVCTNLTQLLDAAT
jgi:hypothetical protein